MAILAWFFESLTPEEQAQLIRMKIEGLDPAGQKLELRTGYVVVVQGVDFEERRVFFDAPLADLLEGRLRDATALAT